MRHILASPIFPYPHQRFHSLVKMLRFDICRISLATPNAIVNFRYSFACSGKYHSSLSYTYALNSHPASIPCLAVLYIKRRQKLCAFMGCSLPFFSSVRFKRMNLVLCVRLTVMKQSRFSHRNSCIWEVLGMTRVKWVSIVDFRTRYFCQ